MQTLSHSKELSLRYRTSMVTKQEEEWECRICGAEKPVSQFYRKAAPGKWGYHVCRDCTHQAYIDAKELAVMLLAEGDKRQIKCRLCRTQKGLPEYYVSAIASHLQDFPVVCKCCSKTLARQNIQEKKLRDQESQQLGISLHDLLGE